jgi:hypothetical protein
MALREKGVSELIRMKVTNPLIEHPGQLRFCRIWMFPPKVLAHHFQTELRELERFPQVLLRVRFRPARSFRR